VAELWVEVGQIKHNAQLITLLSVSFYYFIKDENTMDRYNTKQSSAKCTANITDVSFVILFTNDNFAQAAQQFILGR
jgi:hypothetical protein